MKQPRIPLSRETHPSADLLLSSPNPNSHKTKVPSSSRKHKVPKENTDPNSLPDSSNSTPPSISGNGKPSSSPGGSAKIKSPLPPRPPSSLPLKRKLSVDAVPDSAGPCSATAPSSSDSGVKVIVRVRPLRKDLEGGEMIVKKLSNDSLSIDGQTFNFDSVADTESTQVDIFQLVGAPLVENCLAGYSSSVFAYGQTGSGKTYTMWGPANALLEENLSSDQQGLTPRVFEWLFARINDEQMKHAEKQLKYQCWCSFLEIYNEQIRDLLDPSQKNLQIREDVKSGVYVENLTEESVSTMKDVIQILLKGLSNRRTGSTSINTESSRSHSVFTCVVESRFKSVADGLSSLRISRINLVDLAGSERQKLTGAAGDRLKEAGNINRSLSQLGNLINILAEVSQTGKQRHIPYRDSRLTFLLQESLGGNAKLAMICAISPAQSCKSETFSTLRFAQRAKAIKNKAVVNEVVEDDVNVLREMIRQLKDELLQMKANGNKTEPNGAYSNGWNARRSLNLLKFSLGRTMTVTLPHVDDDDGDEVMEIDEEAVEKLYGQFCPQPARGEVGKSMSYLKRLETIESESQCMFPKGESGPKLLSNASRDGCNVKQVSNISDVSMEEGTSEIEDKHITDSGEIDTAGPAGVHPPSDHSDTCAMQEKVAIISNACPIGDDCLDKVSESNLLATETPCGDAAACLSSLVHGTLSDDRAGTQNSPPNCSKESDCPNLGIVSCDICEVLQSPTPSVSPRVISASRKSLRTSSMVTASQKDPSSALFQGGVRVSSPKASNQSVSFAEASPSMKSGLPTTDYLAASLQRGLEIIDNHRHSSPLRHSPFRFSFRPTESKPILSAEKANVGVQTLPEDAGWADQDGKEYLCSKCGNDNVQEELEEGNENSNLQMVPVDGCLCGERSKAQLPKAVEKVLTRAIRREMALEEFCGKQASEIMQLNRLVQQYKHERECNGIIGQMREDKIIRLENLMDGVLPTEDFLEEELISLRQEHELLKEKYDNNLEMLSTKVELKRVQDELEGYRNFFDMGERDVLLEEIQDLRTQLQYYTDNSSKSAHWRSSLPKLTYSCESRVSLPLNAIPESSEEGAEEKLEQESPQWTEMESKWISLAEELRMELESSRSLCEKLKYELESERKCSEELKEALQLAMEGHARMLEQYADLEEMHMEVLARHRKIQEGIDGVKRAAARARVRGAESRFINALAAEISALKVEREKERRYLRDENKFLQAQLRDTAEAVQAAGELLVRLKEAEEAVAFAQKRAAAAENETAKAYEQIDELKRKHEMEIHTLNLMMTEYPLPKQASQDAYLRSNAAKYNTDDQLSSDDQRWKQEFEIFYTGEDSEFSNFDSSSWFSGYDRCNI